MKKRTVKMMSLALAVLLMASLAVPAMAASGTGQYGQYAYNWSVTRTTSSGRASITTPSVPATVGAAVRNKVRNSAGLEGWACSDGSSSSTPVAITGYASASATAANQFVRNSVFYSGTVIESHGTFWVNSKKVVADALA